MKNKNGQFVFRAIDQKMQPVIIQEGKKPNSTAIWEAQVSTYLTKRISKIEMVEYGEIKRRWKRETFEELKRNLISEGRLRSAENEVVLHLSEERCIFKGSDAHDKADLYLKGLYQFIQTPHEELEEEKWRPLKGFLLGYLSISTPLLAAWKQKSQVDRPPIPDESFVANALNQYCAKSLVAHTTIAYLATLAIGQKERAPIHALGSAFLSLIRGVEAQPTHNIRQGDITSPSKTKNPQARSAAAGPSILNPFFPQYLNIGQYLSLPMDILETFQTPNPDENLIVSARMANGSSLSNWLSFKYVTPQLIGSLASVSNNRRIGVSVQGNYAYLVGAPSPNYGLQIIDRSADSNPINIGKLKGFGADHVKVVGNYAFLSGGLISYLSNSYQQNFTSVDISNPANPKNVQSLILNGPYNSPNNFDIKDTYAFVAVSASCPNCVVENGKLVIIDISDPSNMQQVSEIPSKMCRPPIKVDGNYAYVGSSCWLNIYDITDPKNPVLFSSTALSNIDGMDVSGDYLVYYTGGRKYRRCDFC